MDEACDEVYDAYRMRMRMGEFMPVTHLWTFRVYGDSAIEIDLQVCDDDTMPDEDQELSNKFFVHRARIVTTDEHGEGKPCEFFMNKVGTNDGFWAVRVEGSLSETFGFQGAWYHRTKVEYLPWNDTIESGIPYTIERAEDVSVAAERVVSPLYPLTRGVYSFQASVTGNGMYICHLEVNLELLAAGRLTGEVYNVSSKETGRVQGTWSSTDRLKMIESFPEGGDHVFVYLLKADRQRVTGQCDGATLSNLDAAVDGWVARSDARCWAEMTATSVRRQWNTVDHALYPKGFREAVGLCLLWASAAVDDEDGECGLPSELWLCVFEFCDFDWFPTHDTLSVSLDDKATVETIQ